MCIRDRDITGVLDGQQRLNSMYVALQGSYAYHMKGRWRDRRESYPERVFHLNLFFEPDGNSQVEYQFSFRTLDEADPALVNESTCWFPVKKVLEAEQPDEVYDLWDDFIAELSGEFEVPNALAKKGRNSLVRLYNRLTTDCLLYTSPSPRDLSTSRMPSSA